MEKSQKGKIAFYAGSFDPLTRGHWNIICEALSSFSKVYVGIGVNPNKKTLLTSDERVACINHTIDDFLTECCLMDREKLPKSWQVAYERLSSSPNIVEPIFYNGLTIDTAIKVGADTLVRGGRNAEDMAYEDGLSRINSELLKVRGRELNQVILMPENQKDFIHISSSMTKSLCVMQEYITAEKMVFPTVYNILSQKYVSSYIKDTMGNMVGVNEAISNISDWKMLAAGINYLNVYESQYPFENPNIKKEILYTIVLKMMRLKNQKTETCETPQIQKALSFIEEKVSSRYSRLPTFVCEHDGSKNGSDNPLQRL